MSENVEEIVSSNYQEAKINQLNNNEQSDLLWYKDKREKQQIFIFMKQNIKHLFGIYCAFST